MFDLDALLGAGFLSVRLGLFELHLPAESALDQDRFEDYRSLARALLRAQGRWLEWLGGALALLGLTVALAPGRRR